MIVAHYNTYSSGGAFVLMSRLHHRLRAIGVDSRLRVRTCRTGLADVVQLEHCKSWLDRQVEHLAYRVENKIRKTDAPSYFSRLNVSRSTRVHDDDLQADIIHLHWIGRWLDLPSFLSSVPDTIPVVWTIHDMNPLAGGCFTYSGCDAFATGCRRCPLLKSPFDRFVAGNEFRRRLKALKNRRIHLVGNSRFTTSLAERSGLFQHAESISTVLPSLNPSDFVAHDKHIAKQQLGIPEDCLVLGFGAAVLTDENKGYVRFADVAARVASAIPKVQVLLFGDGPVADVPGATMQSLGSLSSPALQSVAYSAMDVFVVASRMESFGQVAIEAQMCGTPVWAFNVGGLSDAIVDGATGCLVPFEECDTMAVSILRACNRMQLHQMGQAGRRWVSESFTTDEMAKKYMAVYNEALA